MSIQGLKFFVTPNITPSPVPMKEIIECAGGEVDMGHFFNLICRCFSNVTLNIANYVTLLVESTKF